MTVYVSDILEDLLAAGRIRGRVRSVCMELLDDLPAHQRAVLASAMHYYGGKCMGYPPIWAIATALELDEAAEIRLIRQIRGTLFANITTSVVDDLFDDDGPSDPRHLGILYLLFYGALATGEWSADYRGPALATFASALDSAMLDVWPGGVGPEVLRARGQRIGAFFALTGEAAARALNLSERRRQDLVDMLTDLGIACGHIDDAIDVLDDLKNGNTTNAVLLALAQRKPVEFEGWIDIITSERGRRLILAFLEQEFAALAQTASAKGWSTLAERYIVCAKRLSITVPIAGAPLSDCAESLRSEAR